MNTVVVIGIVIALATIVGYIVYTSTTPLSLVFDGTGFTTFAAGGDYNTTITNFSCNLKTTDGNGLILYGKAADDDMFSLKLADGHVVAEIDAGSGVRTLSSNKKVDNGGWHRIKLTRDHQYISLVVDNETIPGLTGFVTGITRPNIVYMGGSILDISTTVKGFVGCLKNITFGDRLANDIEFDLSAGGVGRRYQNTD